MFDKIKRHFIMKWIEEYIEELRQIEIIYQDAELEKIRDLRGDLNICEKVFDTYYSIIGIV